MPKLDSYSLFSAQFKIIVAAMSVFGLILSPMVGVSYGQSCNGEFEESPIVDYVVTDAEIYEMGSSQIGNYVIITISGKVSEFFKGLPVFISVQDPAGEITSLKSYVQSDGHFGVPYILSQSSTVGTYFLDASYKNQNLVGTSFELKLHDSNKSPISQIDTLLKQPFTVGKPIVFSALESFDIDGTITEYYWNFGDEVIGSNPRVPHAYLSEGFYCVTLTVFDDSENSDSAYLEVNILES